MSQSSRILRDSVGSVMALEGDALEDYCKQVFQLCDSDGDGYITEKDMVQQCGGEDVQTLESVMKYLDKDNDGLVSFDEFLSGFKVYQDAHKEEDGEEDRGRGIYVTPPTPSPDMSIFESDPTALMDGSSWVEVAKRIDPEGLLNKSDVASVWAALELNDPTLLDNFESFLTEVVEELHQSQSARETMEHHVKKVLDRHHKEANELDDLLKQHVCDAEESLTRKSTEKSRKLSTRYQGLLAERDALISELSANQSTLKRALEERMESEAILRQERERLMADNRTLQERLEASMKQLAEEESKEAPPRGVASLPDISKIDESDAHHHGYVKSVPECSTPTSVKTFKSIHIANQVKSCSLHNLFRSDGGGDGGGGGDHDGSGSDSGGQGGGNYDGGGGSGDDNDDDGVETTSAHSGTQVADHASETLPQSSGRGFPSPIHTPNSSDNFVHIGSNQCSPAHPAADINHPLCDKQAEFNSNCSTGRTSPDGQPVITSQSAGDTSTTGNAIKTAPSYAQVAKRRGQSLYNPNSMVSSHSVCYGHSEGAVVGSGWFTASSNLPTPSGGVTRVFKVASLGNCGVGKSTLIAYLSQGEFRHCTATVGVDFVTKTLTVGDERVVFQLWDTAGQEKFHSVTMAHYRRADAFIIVYDVTNAKSFKDVLSWVNIIKAAIRDDSPVIMLIGNQCDKVNNRVVSKEDGLRMAAGLNAVFAETSAFSGSNVMEAHANLAQLLLQKEDDAILSTKKLLTQPTPARNKFCAC